MMPGAYCNYGECDAPIPAGESFCEPCKRLDALRAAVQNHCIECGKPCGHGRLCATCYFKVKS
jgi:hypothetical protein